MFNKKSLFLWAFVTLVMSCNQKSIVKNGDIIFRGAHSSELSEAINEVTQTEESTNYTHMGICAIEDGEVVVYHSDLGKGVVRESLKAFLLSKDDNNTYKTDVYRINNITSSQIDKAIQHAKDLLGKPYNTTYIFEDEGYYCSEYIYELFKEDSIFQLEPMTFKNPKTNLFHEGWISHYEALGIEIPEGKLGCNPNGMANSDNLVFISHL